MSGPAVTKRTLAMVAAYEAGGSLEQVAYQFGVKKQRIHAVIKRHKPSAMRPQTMSRFPCAGKPGYELYTVGQCKTCEVSLHSYRPVARDICGHCEKGAP